MTHRVFFLNLQINLSSPFECDLNLRSIGHCQFNVVTLFSGGDAPAWIPVWAQASSIQAAAGA